MYASVIDPPAPFDCAQGRQYAALILRGTCGEHTCGEHTCGEHTCGEQTCGEQIKPIEFRSRVIVGWVRISRVVEGDQFYEWHRSDVQRAGKLRAPTGHSQPVWFEPF